MDQLLDMKKVDEFAALIDRSTKIVLTCHVRPDGDALGSTLGFCHLFRRLGKEASVVVPDQPPRSLAFMPDFKNIAVYTRYDPYCSRLVGEADLIVCCDFNTPERQDQMASLIQNAAAPKVLVDHHQEPSDFADVTLSYPDMSSTCELVFRIIAAMGLFADLDTKGAECLLTGIITDTRNFTVNVKHPDIYEILGFLMEKGARKEVIIKEALNTRSLASLRLWAHALDSRMEILERHHAAIITLDRDTLERFHYERGDTEGLVNMPLEVRGMVCSFMMREDPEYIRISARSAYDYPVSEICSELFGGGGHRMAAGGEFKGTLEEARQLLIDNLHRFDCYLPSKIEKIEI